MILWTSEVTKEDEPEYPEMGRRSWRWVLETDLWRDESALFGVGIGFTHQILSGGHGETWRPANHYYTVSLTRHFAIGSHHAYYDGPHCSFSLGFLHINWSGGWCTKCMPDE